MRSGWLSGSTVTAVPTRRRRSGVAIELATWRDAEITERFGGEVDLAEPDAVEPQSSAR